MLQSNNKSSLKKGKIYGIKTGQVQTIAFLVISRVINVDENCAVEIESECIFIKNRQMKCFGFLKRFLTAGDRHAFLISTRPVLDENHSRF